MTIVTVCRNAAGVLGRALSSVESQMGSDGSPFLDYEHLIIDGASTDGTVAIARAYAARQNKRGVTVTVISEPDEGIYDAMNKGLALARGEYIAFLNADDRYDVGALGLVEKLARSTAADCIGGACEIVEPGTGGSGGRDGCGTFEGSSESDRFDVAHPAMRVVRRRPVMPEMLDKKYPQEMPAAHQSLFVRTKLMRELRGFRPQFCVAADYDLCLGLLGRCGSEGERKPHWAFTDEVLSYFTLGGESYHPTRTARDYRDVRLANGWPYLMTQLLYLRNACASRAARLLKRS